MKKTKFIITLLLVGLIILGVIGYISYNNKNSEVEKNPSSENSSEGELNYKFVKESDYDIELTDSKSENSETVDYYFDSCKNKEMPKVTFKIEDKKLAIENFYDSKYYINSITNVKEILIRRYQSNSSQYLVILTENGEVYASRLWGICDDGTETVLTPEELNNHLTKINIDNNITSIGKTIGENLSLVYLYDNDNNKLLLNFE